METPRPHGFIDRSGTTRFSQRRSCAYADVRSVLCSDTRLPREVILTSLPTGTPEVLAEHSSCAASDAGLTVAMCAARFMCFLTKVDWPSPSRFVTGCADRGQRLRVLLTCEISGSTGLASSHCILLPAATPLHASTRLPRASQVQVSSFGKRGLLTAGL